MIASLPGLALTVGLSFFAGFGTHLLYARWTMPGRSHPTGSSVESAMPLESMDLRQHAVTFKPENARAAPVELPLLEARNVEQLRGLKGNEARIRGRVYRVGHSAKSNTYFINFGPSRDALTAVIFASAVPAFEERKLLPQAFAGKDIEIRGVIKDHPQYGLEVILDDPRQVTMHN
jgi:hypothetical protein